MYYNRERDSDDDTDSNDENDNLDLSGEDLSGEDLSGRDLSGRDLSGEDLSNANLEDANLQGANLQGANLSRTNLSYANLQGAILEDANLQGANLQGANLQGANLKGTNLEGANLLNANLKGANLKGTNLEGANLESADLEGANLRDANLEGADLSDANLEGANLRYANLEGANLDRANLNGAEIEGTILDDNYDDHLIEGIAYEVHNKSDKLISNKKFLNIIKPETNSPNLVPFDYDNIQQKFVDFINNGNNFKNTDKKQLIEKLKTVITKASSCEKPGSNISIIINKGVDFAFKQDTRFTESYIDIFIDETSKAYDTGTDTVSCVAGIDERFYTSLLGAALQVETIKEYELTPKIKTLYCIASVGNVQKDPNEIIQKWSESWEGKDDEWKKMSKEERVNNFKTFMLEDYKKDDCYQENKATITETINKKAEEINDVFKNNEAVDNDGVQLFGGRKRKNKKTRRNEKSKKVNKVNNKKSKKVNKVNNKKSKKVNKVNNKKSKKVKKIKKRMSIKKVKRIRKRHTTRKQI
mgnify:CR=1 FL=1